MIDNICRYVPTTKQDEEIDIINLVLETKNFPKNDVGYTYKLCCVVDGNGTLVVNGHMYNIEEGDIFLTFPGEKYTINNNDDLKYIFISFLGKRANMILEKLKISPYDCIYKNTNVDLFFWKSALYLTPDSANLRCEAIVLYVLSEICENAMPQIEKKKSASVVERVKNYIDEHYFEANISLDSISTQFSYNKRYISSAFKMEYKIGIAKYINMLKIRNACFLMEQGFTSVKDISFRSGFNDPLYFSKVFSKTLNCSPKEYISKLRKTQ